MNQRIADGHVVSPKYDRLYGALACSLLVADDLAEPSAPTSTARLHLASYRVDACHPPLGGCTDLSDAVALMLSL